MSFWGWVFVFVILSSFAWFLWSAPVILLIFPVLWYANYKNGKERKSHFSSLLKGREKDTICSFSRHFECREIDTWVIRAVYEQLQNYMASTKEDFPIRATDDVFTDLRIDDEDFEMDIVGEIAERTGRTLDLAEENKFYGKANIVENLVYFFNEQPVKNET